VTLPSTIFTTTRLIVEGQRLVTESESDCCYDTTDPDDALYVQIRDETSAPITGSVRIADGGMISKIWEHFSVDFTDDIDLESLAGQDVQVYFYVTHDIDYDCTFFYLDVLECNVCGVWTYYLPVSLNRGW
jgi:hypothetical protein